MQPCMILNQGGVAKIYVQCLVTMSTRSEKHFQG